MATAEVLSAIRCTQCGGSVNLNGGHKVQTIVCAYCGSCMDAKNEFKVITQFMKRTRPGCPIKLGAKGKLRGVQFVAIGMLEYTNVCEGLSYPWLEILLYSKTHGYAYLVYENLHWVFLREVKDLPSEFIGMGEPKKKQFSVRDMTFQVFEAASASLTYVEGELTWKAKVGDKVKYVDTICPPYLYCLEEGSTEREYFFGEYIPAEEIFQAFKVTGIVPSDVYACQPYVVSPLWESIAKVAMVFSLVNFMVFCVQSSSGREIFSQSFQTKALSAEATSNAFEVKNPGSLLGMEFICPLRDAWAFFDVSVQKEDNEFFSLSQEMAYFAGEEDGESWSEGSQEVTAYFRVPEAGTYQLGVAAEGGTGESETPNGIQDVPMTIKIREGVQLASFSFYFAILCLICGIPHYWRKYRFECQRWQEEEDDD